MKYRYGTIPRRARNRRRRRLAADHVERPLPPLARRGRRGPRDGDLHQGDFVSYTWPDLIHQATQLAKASIFRQWHLWLIGGAVALYSILMLIVFALVT
jgi:hypothetical protein